VQLGKLEGIVGRFHTVKMRILKQLQTFGEITPQKLNDPAGEIGYTLRFFPASIELGTQIVNALAAEGIAAGIHAANPRPDWHLYADMFPITLKTGTMSNDQPFEVARQASEAVDYSRGLCPVADDLFTRMVSISLNQWYSPNDCDRIARGINKVLAAFCTQDNNARAWI
jgi:8-amino-3,8-dideoxy-alpha-D-manno-octulosonate transaminase